MPSGFTEKVDKNYQEQISKLFKESYMAQKKILKKNGALFGDLIMIEFEIGNTHRIINNPRKLRDGTRMENDCTSFVRFKDPKLKK